MLRRIPFAIERVALLTTFLVFAAAPAAAQSYGSGLGGIGLGFIVGEPSGINAKLWSGPATAIDAGLAWSLADGGATNLYGDFLWHNFDLFDLQSGYLPLYFGVGGRLQFEEDTRFGIRGVVGLSYIFPSSPLDAFLELVPVFDIAPEGDLTFNAAIGARYFFR